MVESHRGLGRQAPKNTFELGIEVSSAYHFSPEILVKGYLVEFFQMIQ